jgi:hypothetical protein
MTKTKNAPELVGCGSHYVNAERWNNEKEEVFLYFNAEWRGQRAAVTMKASRYKARDWGAGDDGEPRNVWTEWNTYCSEARGGYFYVNEQGNTLQERGDVLTETARHRLSEGLDAVVREWLASDAYVTSEHRAWFTAIDRIAGDMRGYGDPPSRDVRLAVERYGDKLTPWAREHFAKLADAYDAYMAVRAEREH